VSASIARHEPGLRQRISMAPDTVERDLARLVLTVVELLRQLRARSRLASRARTESSAWPILRCMKD
jgi:hypothetical protein